MKDVGNIPVSHELLSGSEKAELEARGFVDSIIDDLANLRGTQQGKVVQLEAETDFKWPSLPEYKKMKFEESEDFFYFERALAGQVLPIMRELKGRSAKGYYVPKSAYVGDGKIIIYWKYKRKK